jgi:tRNA A37 threonylcarbamoyladenosine modification protein TsaB
MPLPQIDVVVVALSSPVLVGIYKDKKLVKKIVSEEKTSEVLPKIFKDILKRYEIKRVFFARGPGSFMSIKLVYIFLKSLQIVKKFELFGCDGFAFNKNRPIRAVGNLYFIKDNGKIVTKKFESPVVGNFALPDSLEELNCSEDISPIYVIPAV